jgi:hypothetical protein
MDDYKKLLAWIYEGIALIMLNMLLLLVFILSEDLLGVGTGNEVLDIVFVYGIRIVIIAIFGYSAIRILNRLKKLNKYNTE